MYSILVLVIGAIFQQVYSQGSFCRLANCTVAEIYPPETFEGFEFCFATGCYLPVEVVFVDPPPSPVSPPPPLSSPPPLSPPPISPPPPSPPPTPFPPPTSPPPTSSSPPSPSPSPPSPPPPPPSPPPPSPTPTPIPSPIVAPSPIVPPFGNINFSPLFGPDPVLPGRTLPGFSPLLNGFNGLPGFGGRKLLQGSIFVNVPPSSLVPESSPEVVEEEVVIGDALIEEECDDERVQELPTCCPILTVQEGDDICGIATALGLDCDQFASFNGIEDDVIPGDILQVCVDV